MTGKIPIRFKETEASKRFEHSFQQQWDSMVSKQAKALYEYDIEARERAADEAVRLGDEAMRRGEEAIRRGEEAMRRGEEAMRRGEEAMRRAREAKRRAEIARHDADEMERKADEMERLADEAEAYRDKMLRQENEIQEKVHQAEVELERVLRYHREVLGNHYVADLRDLENPRLIYKGPWPPNPPVQSQPTVMVTKNNDFQPVEEPSPHWLVTYGGTIGQYLVALWTAIVAWYHRHAGRTAVVTTDVTNLHRLQAVPSTVVDPEAPVSVTPTIPQGAV